MSIAPQELSSASSSNPTATSTSINRPGNQRLFSIETQILSDLKKQFDLGSLQNVDAGKARRMLEEKVEQLFLQREFVLPELEKRHIFFAVLNDILGYGPLEPLLKDPQITEIMVNGASCVSIERQGVITQIPSYFRDNQHLMFIIQKIINWSGHTIDSSNLMVDTRLPDKSRVNIILPPLAVHGPALTIRKFAKEPYSLDHLVQIGTLPPNVASFLQLCVQQKMNILTSGGTGTGKTTLLGALAAYMPLNDRIVSIENPVELQYKQWNVVQLETKVPNAQGKGEITQRDLLRNALRMRPDRIIIGEVRGSESFDMLQAMNTGHEGSMTTVHSNSPRDALARIENMALMAAMDLPLAAIREQIASAINLIIQLRRSGDGTRRIVSVHEVVGMESKVVTLQEIFTYKAGRGLTGDQQGLLQPTGIRPQFESRLLEKGIKLPNEWFMPPRWQ